MTEISIPTQSDMSEFDPTATLSTFGLVFHFSSGLPDLFAKEWKDQITYKYGYSSDMTGVSRTYASSEMTAPIQMSEIVHDYLDLPGGVWNRAVVDGIASYVLIPGDSPENIRFMRLEADIAQLGW